MTAILVHGVPDTEHVRHWWPLERPTEVAALLAQHWQERGG
jgi:hypothetical protein